MRTCAQAQAHVQAQALCTCVQQVCTRTSTRACAPMAHVFAHTYADNVRCTHTTRTHTCICACIRAHRDAHLQLHAHAREHPADLYTVHAQGHSTRSLVCCTACTSASVPACPAKNFAPLGPRAAFLLNGIPFSKGGRRNSSVCSRREAFSSLGPIGEEKMEMDLAHTAD